MQFSTFFANNIALFIALFVVLFVIAIYEIKNKGKSGNKISPIMLAQMVNNGALLIDIRTNQEFKSGFIAGAKNIPNQNFSENPDQIKKLIDKKLPIILYDQTGFTVSKITQMLIDQKANQVFYLQGGLDSWKNENLPLVK